MCGPQTSVNNCTCTVIPFSTVLFVVNLVQKIIEIGQDLPKLLQGVYYHTVCGLNVDLFPVGTYVTLCVVSSVEALEQIGQMSRSRAEQVHAHLQHSFNPQMIGSLT